MTVGHLTRLTKLNLSNNCLQTLPREIGLLRSECSVNHLASCIVIAIWLLSLHRGP